MRVFFGKKGQDKVPVVILHSTSKKKTANEASPFVAGGLVFFPTFFFF